MRLSIIFLSLGSCVVTAPHSGEEQAYLDLMDTILREGQEVTDRTGTGAMSLFAPDVLRFSLADGRLPMMTTKKMNPRLVFEEMAFFLRGDTNTNHLAQKGVRIWQLNTSRAFLDQRGLNHLDAGDMGAAYSHQWRHQGADYCGMNADYRDQGIDQIAELLWLLEYEADSRRALVVSWNAAQLCQMALPPCHFSFQCRRYHNQLYLHLTLRSSDTFLGLPYNILGYAFLLHMIAHVLHLEPNQLTISIGDAHVYLNHVAVVKTQIGRVGYPFPKIKIHSKLTGESLVDLLAISWEDIEITDYQSDGPLRAPMAV